MALPTLKSQWCFRANGQSTLNQIVRAPESYSSMYARGLMLYYLKASLCGFEQHPWTVVRSRNGWNSSNGRAFGEYDTWTSPACVGTYGKQSNMWIVLQNTFAGRVAQLLIQVTNSNYSTGKAWLTVGTDAADYFGTAVGVDGDAPAIPSTAMKWCGDYVTNPIDLFYNVRGTCRLNVMQSYDSTGVKAIRLAAFQGGGCVGWGFLDQLTEVPSGGIAWDNPVVGQWAAYTGSYPNTFAGISDTTRSTTCHAIYGSTSFQVYATTLHSQNLGLPFWNSGQHSALAAAYQLAPVTGFTSATPPLLGHLGRPNDFWIGSNYVGNGARYGGVAPHLFHVGQFVWPWDPAAGPPQTM